jgi:hypothetical protein
MGRKNAVTAVAGDGNAVGKSPANSPKTNALRRLRRFYSVTLPSAAFVRKVPGSLAVTAVNAVQSSGLEAASYPPSHARLCVHASHAKSRPNATSERRSPHGHTGRSNADPTFNPTVYLRYAKRRRKSDYNQHSRRQPALRNGGYTKRGSLHENSWYLRSFCTRLAVQPLENRCTQVKLVLSER